MTIHYQQAITNTKGDALIGYYVKLADTSDDSAIPLYADSALTPIVSVSGADDACLVDSDGMADFWVGDGTYHMDIYATDGTTLVRRETFVQFGVPAADYGDVTVNDDGTWTVDAVSGTTVSTFAKTILDDADAAAARTTLQIDSSHVKLTESMIIACSDETTDLTTGTAKRTFRMPYAFTLSAVRASVTAAPTGASILVDINEGGVSILSTTISIEASEKSSVTSATPPVISDASLADDAEITIDIDQVGSTVAGKGLKVVLIGART